MHYNELYHFGVKGMRWGVRRNRRTMSSDAVEAKRISKKHVSEMSNAELRKLTERQNLESNYKRLNPSKISKGVKFAAATAAATTTMINLYNNGDKLMKIGKKWVKK